MTRTQLLELRAAIATARAQLAAVRTGLAEPATIEDVERVLGEILVATDPATPRELTQLGTRIVEAADAVGLDVHRLEQELGDTVPSGALTRLLHHPLKNVRADVLDRLVAVIGYEREWLQFGRGEPRKEPVPPGARAARGLGASAEAIRLVREEHPNETWSDTEWGMKYLEKTKALLERPPTDESTTRLR